MYSMSAVALADTSEVKSAFTAKAYCSAYKDTDQTPERCELAPYGTYCESETDQEWSADGQMTEVHRCNFDFVSISSKYSN